jgi:hypothetical protein
MLTADSKRCEHYMEHDGMLGIHILYVMYRWKGRPSSSLKTHYNQHETSRSSYIYLLCFCTPHITRTGDIPVSHSVCARISATWCTARHAFHQCILQQSTEDYLQQRFYSRTNCASLGLGSPRFTMNMHDQMKIIMQFSLTISSDSFSSVCGLQF